MGAIKIMLTGIVFMLISVFVLIISIHRLDGFFLVSSIVLMIIGIVVFISGIFETKDSIYTDEDQIAKIECDGCKKKFDIDYPKCPNCGKYNNNV